MEEALRRTFGMDVEFQYRCHSGIIDAIIRYPLVIIETKLTQTADAYYQLRRYASSFPAPAVRAIITRTVVRSISTPEQPTYLSTLASLRDAEPGYYIIPFIGKRPR